MKAFTVFYRDYENDVSIKSTDPESLNADRIEPIAKRLLANPDNFLGIVDVSDQILQCYLEDDGDVVFELLYPESEGCMRLKMDWDKAMKLLADLPQPFTEKLLPDATYVG